jgi:hypothetical protein
MTEPLDPARRTPALAKPRLKTTAVSKIFRKDLLSQGGK